MGFSLTIQEGKDLGRQFSFDQPEVSIGRTAENDVVLYDPGVSRKHVVIRDEGGRFFVQDQGSANGTQVNGNPVTEEELQTGDLLSVGPVVFSVELSAAAEAANRTRLVDNEKSKVKSKALAKSSPQQLKATSPIQAASKRPMPVKIGGGASARPGPLARPQPKGAAPMLASERARLRRENAGLLGKIKIFFIEAPKAVRIAIIAAGALLGLGGLGFTAYRITHTETRNLGPGDESHVQFPISERNSKDVFGIGDDFGITHQTKDELHFTFDFAESIPVVYYIRFEPQGVDRKEQVDISLNSVHIAYVAPSLGDYTKIQRFKLPKKYLKKGEVNEVVFDHADNPPNAVPWAISKVKLIIRPLPQCVDDECVREAKKYYDLSTEFLEKKDIAAENRFKAWTALHQCLLFLENIENNKPDLFTLAQSTLRDTDKDLDKKCNQILMTAKRAEELKDPKKALWEYKNGLAWFPASDDEHPCRGKLNDKIADYGDTGPR
ncbi:MAG TPA: FHA domain-containing protein [Myxococcales bacterium]|jgi:hypothetical protein